MNKAPSKRTPSRRWASFLAKYRPDAFPKEPRTVKTRLRGKIRSPCIQNELVLARYALHAFKMPRKMPLGNTPREYLAIKRPFCRPISLNHAWRADLATPSLSGAPAGQISTCSAISTGRISPPPSLSGASAGQTPTRLATSTGRIPPCPSASARRILPCSMAPARRILPRDSSRCENLATFCGERFDGHSRQPPCGVGCSSLCAKT